MIFGIPYHYEITPRWHYKLQVLWVRAHSGTDSRCELNSPEMITH